VNDLWLGVTLQAVGLALLILEIFVPSHGLFGIGAAACIVFGVYSAFMANLGAGYASVAVQVIAVPAIALVGVKYFRRTAIGRRVVPPNPVLTDADTSVPVSDLRPLVGRKGRSISPLRPVGVCEFDGQRIQCVAESGLIEAHTDVMAVGVLGGSLSVRPATSM
jgi:membrane-bound serine protease (ClpP class)